MGNEFQTLHPELQTILLQFLRICREKNLNVRITQTFRTRDEQNALYALGRTKPGKIVTNTKYPFSAHCWGVAFDFCRNEKGREYDDKDDFFRQVGEIGKGLGLTWGGDWVGFVDKPHLEFRKFMPESSTQTLIQHYKIPEAFIKTWSKLVPQESVKPTEETKKEEEEMEKMYEKIEEVPTWAKATVQKLMDKKFISGDEKNSLNLSETAIRILVINDRAGLY